MPTNYNISITVDGHDNASKPLRGVSAALADMGKIAGGIQLSQLFDSIIGGVRNLGESAISAAAQFQGLGIAMETLSTRELVKGGAAVSDALAQAGDMADEYMKKLEEISLISPYEWGVVSDMSRLQMAFGAGQDEALDLTRALLDTSAGLGLTTEMAHRLAYNFGQLRMIGKVTGVDLRQLRMVGLDLADVFQSQLGMSIDQVNALLESGRMTMQDVSAAFMQYAAQNFGGAAQKMSRTLMGIKSSFSDLFTFAARDLLTPALDRISERVVKVFDFTQALSKSGLFKEIGIEFAGWVEGMLAGVEQLVSRIGSEGLVGVLGLDEGQVRAFIAAALELAGALSGYLGQALDFVRAHANEFRGALLGIGAALAAGAVVGGVLALAGALLGLVNPVGLVIAAAALMGAAWAGNWGGIQEQTATVIDWFNANVVPAFQTVVDFVQENWPTVESVIGSAMQSIETSVGRVIAHAEAWWDEHGATVTGIANTISQAVQEMVGIVTGQFASGDSEVRGVWGALWNYISTAAGTALTQVETVVTGAMDILGPIVEATGAAMRGDWDTAWAEMQGAAQAGVDTIVQIVQNMEPQMRAAIAVVDSVVPGFEQTINDVVTTVQANWPMIEQTINGVMVTISTEVQNTLASMRAWWDEHGGSIQSIVDSISWAVGQMVSTITGLFQQSDSEWGGIWSTLWEGLKYIVNYIWEEIKLVVQMATEQIGNVLDLFAALLKGDWQTAWEEVKQIAQTEWEFIKGTFDNMLPGFRQTATDIITGIKDAFNEKTQEVEDALIGWKDDAMAELGKLPADMLQIGKDLIGGLIQGIEDSAGQLLTTVKEKITDPLPEWIKGPLGIQSPSTVFHDVGVDIINGLLFGIEAKQPNLLAKMKEVESDVGVSVDRLAALKDQLAAGAGGGIPDKVVKQMQSGIGGILGSPSGNDFIRANLAGTSQDLGDAWDEQARRMADIAARGKSSPWIGMFDIPADIMDEGGNTLKAYAMQWQNEFYAGMKPDEVNAAAVIDQYAQQLQAQLAQQQLTSQITGMAMQDPNIMGMMGQLTGSPLQALGQDATALTSILPTLNPMLSETMSLATGGANVAAAGVAGAAQGATAAVTSPLGQMNLDITAMQGLLGPVGEQLNTLWNTISTKVNEALRQTHTLLSKNLTKSISDAVTRLDVLRQGFSGVQAAVDTLNAALATLLDLLDELAERGLGAFEPGSPTPFELGLRGIRRELEQLDMGGLGPPAVAMGTASRAVEVHLHIGAMLGRESEAREFALKLAPLINEAQKVYGTD